MAATTLAIVGAATAIAGAGASFTQAAKQNRLMSDAETKAAEAAAEAKRRLSKNYQEGLSIQKEPLELEREAVMGTAAQAIEAGKESERGAVATAGRIFEGTQQGQAGIRTAMGKQLQELEQKKADEASRLSDMRYVFNLEEAAGYNQMATDAQRASAQAMTQGFGALQQAAQQGIQNLALYPIKEKKPIPTTATNNYVMQNRQNADTAAQWTSQFLQGFNNPTKSTMLEKPFYQYPSGQVGGILNPNQPPYNAGTYNPFMIFQ